MAYGLGVAKGMLTTISHLIKRMEHELGQPLVVRGRRIRMTRAGQMMVDTAVRYRAERDEWRRKGAFLPWKSGRA